MIVILPSHNRRERHQYRLGTPSRLQSEMRASVINQIEFNVAAPADQLKIAFTFGESLAPALLCYREIGRKKCSGNSLHELEDELDSAIDARPRVAGVEGLVGVFAGQIIEEDSTDSASFVAM